MDVRVIEEFGRWEANVSDPALKGELAGMRAALDAGDPKPVEDAFFRDLEFGTAGLRGILGAGCARMNVHTVAAATAGLALYLKGSSGEPSVAVAYDSRHMGIEFAQVVAGVMAAHGIHAYVFPRLEPTPLLSFAVRELGCSAGINITASHNPAAYNGYKVYGPDGCQITSEAARAIQEAIRSVDMWGGCDPMPFQEALDAGWASWIDDSVVDAFIDAVALQSQDVPGAAASDVHVVYTPLNGTGMECVGRILERIGITHVDVVAEQAMPDGDFTTCPYPNPEERAALELGLALCDEVHPDILVATDPDADRVGIAIPHDGGYRLMSGNEVGILLTHWLAGRVIARGEDLARKVVVTTVVSSSLVDVLAERMGFQLRRTLTGFKYIGEQIALLEAAGEADRFLLGFEESYGYLVGTHARDKDSIVATMLICQMAADARSRGIDLVDELEAIYAEFGTFANKNVSLAYPGAEGAGRMASIMAGLRASAPTELAGLAVTRVVDYATAAPMPCVGALPQDGPQVLPAADVFQMDLEGGNKVIIRPSGTEPKIKAYLFAVGADCQAAGKLIDDLEDAARALLGA